MPPTKLFDIVRNSIDWKDIQFEKKLCGGNGGLTDYILSIVQRAGHQITQRMNFYSFLSVLFVSYGVIFLRFQNLFMSNYYLTLSNI